LLVNIVDRTIFGCDATIWKSKKKIKTLRKWPLELSIDVHEFAASTHKHIYLK